MNVQEIVDELNSLDPQNPGAWPLYVRIAAVVILSIAVIGGGYYFFIQPQLLVLDKEKSMESGLFSEFETKQRKVAALDAYKAQLAEMEKSFGSMLRQLPSRTEVPNLLNDISQTRIASSLEEEFFRPLGEARKEFYAEIPNQLVVLGTYHEMGGFVSGIAALPRIVTIDDVDLRPVSGKLTKKDANSNDGGLLLRMTALAKTYRYLDEQEMPKPKKKGGAKKK